MRCAALPKIYFNGIMMPFIFFFYRNKINCKTTQYAPLLQCFSYLFPHAPYAYGIGRIGGEISAKKNLAAFSTQKLVVSRSKMETPIRIDTALHRRRFFYLSFNKAFHYASHLFKLT